MKLEIKLGTATKLAKNNSQICQFSLPRYKSCPGKTDACSGINGYCYCRTGHHNYASVRDAREHNWTIWRAYEKANKSTLLARMLADTIRKQNKLNFMRWFEEGDLNSQFAVTVVSKACKMLPEYNHMIPTKSVKLNLNPIAKLDNTSLLLSADSDNYKECISKAQRIIKAGYNCKIAWSAYHVDQEIAKNAIACPATGIGKLVGKKGACQYCQACYQNNSIDTVFYRH
jgi:hypothetical protein